MVETDFKFCATMAGSNLRRRGRLGRVLRCWLDEVDGAGTVFDPALVTVSSLSLKSVKY